MLILGIDTSTSIGSVALYDTKNGTLGEININANRTHSEVIEHLIKKLFDFTDRKINEIDRIAVTIGPGSFTGIRIGVALAKGLALSLNKEIVGINELDLIANNFRYFDGNIYSLIDAKNMRVYWAKYIFKNEKLELLGTYQVSELREILKKIDKNKKNIFVGDGGINYCELIKEQDEHAIIAYHAMSMPRAVVACELASIKNTDNVYLLEPFYANKSQAERNKDIKNNL